MSDDEIISGFVSELRRGTVVLGVLNQLSSPKYGYSLGQELTEKGVPVDGNTLYPLLRRLEGQGLLKSEWDMSEGKPRKYYVRTAKGSTINSAIQLREIYTFDLRLGKDMHIGRPPFCEPWAVGAGIVMITGGNYHRDLRFLQRSLQCSKTFRGVRAVKQVAGQKNQVTLLRTGSRRHLIGHSQQGSAQK